LITQIARLKFFHSKMGTFKKGPPLAPTEAA
jgi:hypothetical protein